MAKAKKIADYNSIFAVRLRECMEKQGFTQSELAASIGKSRQAVNFYTLGETVPDADTLVNISYCLDVSVDYLLGLSDAAVINTTVQDIHRLTGLSEKAIDTLIEINDKLSIFDGAPKEVIKTINYLVERMDYSKYGYRNDVLPVLSQYLTRFTAEKDDVLFVIPEVGKQFKSAEEAFEYAEKIVGDEDSEQDSAETKQGVTVQRVKTSEFVEAALFNKLIKVIQRAKSDLQKDTATDDN